MSITKVQIDTPSCGKLNVVVQGDLNRMEHKAIFVTVHDIGSNHQSWQQFVEHPSMKETRDRSIFFHVDIPGQEDNAPDLADDFNFPTMQNIAKDLVNVLDHFGAKAIIGLGEGSGANILARFGMLYQDRCYGLVLVHCTASTAGMMENLKDKFINWKLNSGMAPTAEQYLVFHKFGHIISQQLDTEENKERLIKEYQDRLQTKINAKNLRQYINNFRKRTDLISKLETQLKVDTLLVTGSKASHNEMVHNMHQNCNKSKASLLKIDDVGDVLVECPEKFAQSLILFCQGLGSLTSVSSTRSSFSGPSMGDGAPGAERGGKLGKMSRQMSMEEYDTPNIRRFSFSAN